MRLIPQEGNEPPRARGGRLCPDKVKGMIVERSMSDPWLSNTYVVADEMGGSAVMVDAGGPVAPLLEYINRGQFDLTHILLTHHHHDHVADVDAVLQAWPGTPVLIHERE